MPTELIISSFSCKKLDTICKKFKEEFSYYPKSGGAWWVGADAFDYMPKKYHIIVDNAQIAIYENTN